MIKYSLDDSLETLDYIKRINDIDEVKKFKFSDKTGYGAIFHKRRMINNEYIITKGFIKNQMICYKEKKAVVTNVSGNIKVDKLNDSKIVYGNIDYLKEITFTNTKDLENSYNFIKKSIIDVKNKMYESDYDIIESQIRNTVSIDTKYNKVIVEKPKMLSKKMYNK